MDEIIVMMFFISMGVISNHIFIGAGVGWLAMSTYSKFNSSKQPGFTKHIAYKYGMWGKKKIPEYWIKELVNRG